MSGKEWGSCKGAQIGMLEEERRYQRTLKIMHAIHLLHRPRWKLWTCNNICNKVTCPLLHRPRWKLLKYGCNSWSIVPDPLKISMDAIAGPSSPLKICMQYICSIVPAGNYSMDVWLHAPSSPLTLDTMLLEWSPLEIMHVVYLC